MATERKNIKRNKNRPKVHEQAYCSSMARNRVKIKEVNINQSKLF